MNDDYERLQLQTKKKYVLDTFRNGLRCIQDDSKVCLLYTSDAADE